MWNWPFSTGRAPPRRRLHKPLSAENGTGMQSAREQLYRAAFYLAFASALTILISITASQTLLGLSLASLMASRHNLRLPRIWLPLALFLAGTLLSLITSPEPAHGLPQVKKMFVFSMLLVVFS